MSGFGYTGRVNKIAPGQNVSIDSSNPAIPVVSVSSGPPDLGGYYEAHMSPNMYVLGPGDPIALGEWLPIRWAHVVKALPGVLIDGENIKLGGALVGKKAFIECVVCNVAAPLDLANNPEDDPVIGGATEITLNGTVISCGFVNTTTTTVATSGIFTIADGDLIATKWRTAERDETKHFRGIGGPLTYMRIRVVG